MSGGLIDSLWAEPTFVDLNVSRVAPESVKTRSDTL